MLSIRTVLCPVDLTPATARQVDVALDVCRAFGARLVVHHNFVELGVGAGVGWMWAVDHSAFERNVEAELRGLLAAGGNVEAEVRLTRGPIVQALLAVAASVEADLVVLSTRGANAGLDGSITERILEDASFSVLAIHDAHHEHQTPRFAAWPAHRQTLLVPTDLTPASQPALDVAFDLVRRFRFEAELFHVIPDTPRARDTHEDDVWIRLSALVPADVQRHVHRRIDRGVPARVIADAARHVSAGCIVMGEHSRSPMRHWFRPDTSMDVLHRAPCPIWYVSNRQHAATADAARESSAAPVAHVATHAPLAAARAESNGEPHLVDALKTGRFRYWPTQGLYGVVDSPDEAESALGELLQAGVPRELLHIWHGSTGRDAIDPTGEKHGRAAKLWRALERATPERDLLNRYAAEVESGHVCISVHCGAGEGRQIVASILQRHGGHLLAYFSVGSVERLS
jgi:nucleotide-binding universal stress UspA family protein